MLDVTLMINTSPAEQVNKDLQSGITLQCALKDKTSILRPTLIIKSSAAVYDFNYLYIPALKRYYFIDDILSVNNGIWEISAHVDVLETYKSSILDTNCIIENTERSGNNLYLPDNEFFKVNCKHYTDILTFPQGLSDTGEFILITAGG